MDYIFLIGPSAVGKTTLGKGLYEHYKGVFLDLRSRFGVIPKPTVNSPDTKRMETPYLRRNSSL